VSQFDRLALLASLAVAAWLRLPGIDARGRFDADQGHDMLTLLAFTRDGVVPLLGPKTSVGDFHHGAFYYYLLAPSAAVSGSDPVVVTAFLALLGIAAVALTWWLGRAIGGPMAGAIAGLLLAASPAAIEESTFIWNPNAIGFFAALALAAAWRARSGGNRAWWAVALAAAGAVVQLHVLGVVFFVAILAIVLIELRRDRNALLPLVGGLAAVGVLFVPLLIHELQTDFAETQGVLAYLRGGDDPIAANPVSAIVFTLFRVIGWPLVGLITDVPSAAAAGMVGLTVAGAVLALRLVPPAAQPAVRWLIGLLLWSTLALAFAAPSLQRVVAGLPNDHYHAFLDSVVVLLLAVPAGILFERATTTWRTAGRPSAGIAAALVGVLVVAVFTAEMVRRPPKVDPDAGWPALRDAGARVVSTAARAPIHLLGLPSFKLPDALGFPIVRAGGRLAPPSMIDMPTADGVLVVVCDRLFEAAIGAPCGGPAEDALVAGLFPPAAGVVPDFVDRFDASPRTSVSIYRL
jgi:4-amino-4-deoxy-L-arabinose transferase-like glycosyltransferase